MSLVVLFFIGRGGLRDLVGVLDGETRGRRGIGFRRRYQIVETFIAAMEILVLLLHVGQGSFLGRPESARLGLL